MNLKCFTHGHDYKKVDERWYGDTQDEFMATNHAHWTIKYYGYDLYRCDKCLKEKRVSNDKHKYETV